jgi:hypothetical protein
MEKSAGGDNERDSVPAERYADVQLPPGPPIAPDGGIAPGYGIQPAPAPPEATPDAFVCLRGPCRHYWHLETFAGAGNPKGTFENLGLREPRQINRTCIANPGHETDLTEDCVYECNLWDPLSPDQLDAIEARRRRYFEANQEPQEPLEGE